MKRTSEHLETEVWVKRDDLTSPLYGGNKVRKLEHILARARERGADTLITTGAAGSHHVFATSLFGKQHGFETHAVLTPQARHPHVEAQLRSTLAIGTRVTAAASYPGVAREIAELTLKLRVWGQRPFVIPAGGSSVTGTLGFVDAGIELASQIDRGDCPDPDAVYVACGTCATAAGIALGLCAAGVRTRVVAVRVTDKLFANRVKLRRLVRKAEQLLQRLEPRFPAVADAAIASLALDEIEIGKGYGMPTPSALHASELAARDGLTLDPTYTSKALACLVREAESTMQEKRVLFWDTLSSASMQSFLAEAPQIPEALAGLLK